MKIFLVTLIVVAALAAMSCKENKPASGGTPQSADPVAAAPSAGAQVQVDEYPVPVNHPSPAYPKTALAAHQEGTVWLNVIVSTTGSVKEVSVIKSSPDVPALATAAVEAAKQWTFKPAKKDGRVVELMVTIPFRFKLSDEDKKEK